MTWQPTAPTLRLRASYRPLRARALLALLAAYYTTNSSYFAVTRKLSAASCTQHPEGGTVWRQVLYWLYWLYYSSASFALLHMLTGIAVLPADY